MTNRSVPSSKWPVARLGDALRLDLDRVPVDAATSYPMVGVLSFGRGLFDREPIENGKTSYRVFYRLKATHVVMSQLFGWEGALALSSERFAGRFLSPQFPTFLCDASKLDRSFLGWLMRRPSFWDDLGSRASGMGDRRRTLTPEALFQCEIPLPPLAEQRQIVARIEELAAQIDEARTLRHQADEMAEALLKAAVSSLFVGNEYWKSVRDAVAISKGAVRSGPFGSQLLHEEFIDAGVAAIGTRDVQTDRFELRGGWFVSEAKYEQFKHYRVFPGDVLCTIVGASIGRFCVVPETVPLAFTTKHVQALTLDNTKAVPRFVSVMLNYHHRCRDSLFSQVEGSAQPSLNAGKILATLLPLPPPSDQRRIVAGLDALQAQINALKRLQAESAAELDALLPAILDRSFKGEL